MGNVRSRNWVAVATDIILISIGLFPARVHHFFNPFAGSSTVSAQVAPPSSSPLRSVGQLSNFRPPFRRNKPKRGKGRQGREEGVRGDYRCSDKDAFQELVY